MTACLLVGPLARHEDRDVDLVDEGDRGERIGHLGDVVVVRADLAHQVSGLGVERLVGRAGRVAVLNLLPGVGLPAIRTGRLGLVLALLGPVDGEPGVEDAAGIERRLRLVDHRERRDRGEVRRLGLRGEQLADAAVGDAHHPHLAVGDPRLMRHRLHDVVAVEVLQRLEEVERPARAARAAHVDVDDGEPHQVGERGDAAHRPVGLGVAVARVLDQGRGLHAGCDQRRELAGQLGRKVEALGVRDVRRRMDRVRQLGAVAGGHVAVAVRRDRLVVDVGRGRGGLLRQDRQRSGRLAGRVEPHPIAISRRDLAEQDPAEVVGGPGLDHLIGGVEQRGRAAGGQAGCVDLLDAAVRIE